MDNISALFSAPLTIFCNLIETINELGTREGEQNEVVGAFQDIFLLF